MTFDPTRLEVYKLSCPFWLEDGAEFPQELSVKELADGNVLKFLLENPQLISEEWKKQENPAGSSPVRGPTICFLGTVSRKFSSNSKVHEVHPNGYPVTPCLTWMEDSYEHCTGFLSYEWRTKRWWCESTIRSVQWVAVLRGNGGAD